MKISLRRRHALMVEDGASTHKIDYFRKFEEIPIFEGHSNYITGLRVTAFLLKGEILPIVGVALGRVCACSLRSRLVYTHLAFVPSPIIYLSGAWNGSQSLICCQRLPGAPNPNWFPLFYLEICIAAIMDQFPSAAANACCVPTVLFFPTKTEDDMFFFHHYGRRIHFFFISAPQRGCVSSVCQNGGDYLDFLRSHTACCTQQEKLWES